MGLNRMAAAIRLREISPVEVMASVFRRIDEVNPRVNAFCTLLEASAMAEARRAEAQVMQGEVSGRLHGVPVSIKDLIFTSGVRTTGGSPIFENFVPDRDAIVVERLKAAGAIIVGKTNTSEFGWVAITDNRLFGPTRNPWNTERTPGGSSGGAASSVALGVTPLAIGSDGGGSIRIPASFCGIFGIKPSHGRVPQHAGFPGWETYSHTGPLTRSVADAALALEVIAGRDDRDRFSIAEADPRYLSLLQQGVRGLRIAWSPDLGYATLDPEVRALTDKAARVFEQLGANVMLDAPPAPDQESSFSMVVGSRMAAFLIDKVAEFGARMDPFLVRFVERNLGNLAVDYVHALLEQMEFWDATQAFFQKYDLLLTPTVAVPPFEIGKYGIREIDGKKVGPLGWMPFTYPFNITGQPAASVPCGWTGAGLPVGLQIVGRRFDDATVLKAAAAFEQAAPWQDRRPRPL